MKTSEQIFDKNGKYITDKNYTEILRLDEMLTKANIPHITEKFLDGWCVIYPTRENAVADAVEHYGSYGNSANRLEIMGLLTEEEQVYDSVKGWLTAEDVFNRMSEHYNNYISKSEVDR